MACPQIHQVKQTLKGEVFRRKTIALILALVALSIVVMATRKMFFSSDELQVFKAASPRLVHPHQFRLHPVRQQHKNQSRGGEKQNGKNKTRQQFKNSKLVRLPSNKHQ